MVVPLYENLRSEFFQNESHFQSVLNKVERRVDLADVVLKAGDDGILVPAHSLVLIGSSDFFSTLFDESNGAKKKSDITIEGIDGSTLTTLVKFCYTGYVEINAEVVKPLLRSAVKLQFHTVKESCCEFLLRDLKASNCLGISYLAEEIKVEPLLARAKDYILKNFVEVCKHPEFLLISADQLCAILDSDDIVAPTEEFIFRNVIQWIQHDIVEREKCVIRCVSLIRLGQMQPNFINDALKSLCGNENKPNEVVAEFQNIMKSNNNSSKPRKYNSLSLLGIFEDGQNLSVECYCPYFRKWAIWKTPLQPREDFCAVMLKDKLIISGGGYSVMTLKTIEVLNLRTMEVSLMKPMLFSRRNHNSVMLNDSLYMIGGFCSQGALSLVERWNSAQNAWKEIASMKSKRYLAGAALLDGVIYVAGGHDGTQILSSMEAYDEVANVWTLKAPMQIARRRHSLFAHNGFLYACGGETINDGTCKKTDTTERYDPQTDTWTLVPTKLTEGGWTRCISLSSTEFFILTKTEFNVNKLIDDGGTLVKLPTPQNMTKCIDFISTPYITPPLSALKKE